MHQGDHQGVITQLGAVVPQVFRATALLGKTLVNRLAATVLVALLRQGDAQVHQRQAGQALATLVVVKRTQRTQWRTIDP